MVEKGLYGDLSSKLVDEVLLFDGLFFYNFEGN